MLYFFLSEVLIIARKLQLLPTLEFRLEQLIAQLEDYARLLDYYMVLVMMSLAGVLYGYVFSEVYFPGTQSPLVETVMTLLKLSWLIPFPYAIINFYSFVRYPVFKRMHAPRVRRLLDGRFYIRVVTRGMNPQTVNATVDNVRAAMDAVLSRDMWRIEVVTDNPLPLDTEDGQVIQVLVPMDYQTSRQSLYKARALNYALEASEAGPNDWVIHLDEETHINKRTVHGMLEYAEAEEWEVRRGVREYPRIGQGVILYGTREIINWVTTMADSIRVGDDYGRFRLQYESGRATFGMHGSFIVISNRVEQLIGFDHGPKASITEDAYFALVAQSMGIEFAFVNAHMFERSPFSVKDFLKQRKRWFGGLWLCVYSPEIAWKEKFWLTTFMLMWSFSWLSILMVYVNILFPTGTPLWLAVTGGVSYAYYVTLYLIGFSRTFDWREGKARYLRLLVVQFLFIPVFSLLEGAGAFYGLVSPVNDFYIVQKDLAV